MENLEQKPEHVSGTFLWEINKAQFICENCGKVKTLQTNNTEFSLNVSDFHKEHKNCKAI